jgi:hypothetical protein
MQRQVASLVKPALARGAAGRTLFAAAPVRGAATASAGGSSLGASLYQFVFRRHVTYVTYIVGGAMVLEAFYGKATEAVWNTMNNGVGAPTQPCGRAGAHAR